MAQNIKITFAVRWDTEDADGGKCCLCEDLRFGKQVRMILIIGGEDMPQEQALCQSCATHLSPNKSHRHTI